MEEHIESLRGQVAAALGSTDVDHDIQKANGAHCSSRVRAKLLGLWAKAAGDPAAFVADWFNTGAPGGITTNLNDLDKVWARHDKAERLTDPDDLASNYDTFENYVNVDGNPEVQGMLRDLENKGYLKRFSNVEDMEQLRGRSGCNQQPPPH